MATKNHADADDITNLIVRRAPSKPYFPHPAPPAIPESPTTTTSTTTITSTTPMTPTTTLLTTILLPLAIAFALYILLTHVLLPLYHRHHARYSNYLPLPLSALSTHTSTLRQRLQDRLADFVLPTRWRSDLAAQHFPPDSRSGSEAGFDDEDGEELFAFEGEGRREALSLDARRGGGAGAGADVPRLSRDLEEGFADDSEEEEGDGRVVAPARRG